VALLARSNAVVETPRRRAIPNHDSPDATVWVEAFDGEQVELVAAPRGRHRTSPGCSVRAAEASFAARSALVATPERRAIPNHDSPAPTA
jgi:hypothetical protein